MHLSLPIRHVLVALVVALLAGATALGFLGPAVGPERIHSYDVVAVIQAEEVGHSVAVREVIDWDFGRQGKRGIFRRIPHSGGVPEDITVSSPTAPDAARTTSVGNETEIRIGDPSTKVSGRHRYVISYVLPETVVDGRFALNAIGDQWPVASEDVHIAVLGAELAEPRCFTGRLGSTDRCDLEATADGYTVSLDRLDAHRAVTIDGDVGTTRAAEVPEPPLFEERDDSARLRWALIVAAVGGLTALGVFVVCRQVGRNEVAEGGATAAAFVPYGEETFGPHHDAPSAPPPVGGTRLVADSRMGELAGLEFVPPGGVEPWQGAAVLREKVDDRTVGAWFSSLTAHDVIDFDDRSGELVLSPGPEAATADPVTADILNRAMGRDGRIALGSYDPRFATAWSEAASLVGAWVVSSGVFRRRPPVRGGASFSSLLPFLFCLAFPLFSVASGFAAVTGLYSAPLTVLIALAGAGIAALVAYLPLTRSLSARGSAIALRTESFRRFLADSEAQHVEWAWENGLLREYSAWAVALGEADAWNRALSSSSVSPPDQLSASHILIPHLYASSFHSAHTAPSSSGGGGGGGFSGGGFSGGGGGGGGGGSW